MGEKDGPEDKSQTESFEYKLRPIVLVVPRGAPASATELRRKEAELLRGRIDGCDQACAAAESWLDNFETEIFNGKTLNELLHERGGL